jgi:hypothetical protein
LPSARDLALVKEHLLRLPSTGLHLHFYHAAATTAQPLHAGRRPRLHPPRRPPCKRPPSTPPAAAVASTPSPAPRRLALDPPSRPRPWGDCFLLFCDILIKKLLCSMCMIYVKWLGLILSQIYIRVWSFTDSSVCSSFSQSARYITCMIYMKWLGCLTELARGISL